MMLSLPFCFVSMHIRFFMVLFVNIFCLTLLYILETNIPVFIFISTFLFITIIYSSICLFVHQMSLYYID